MKTLLIVVLSLAAWLRVPAQVNLDLALDQDQFLPNEAIRLAVKITNRSGQEMHLGALPTWLTFTVESDDNQVVIKNADVPVVDPFDLESSQMATKHVNLQPYFQMARPGRYKVSAAMRIPEWSLTVNSTPIHFDVINGGEIWSQDFGVTVATNQPPESRKFSLIKANYLREQLRLYVQVGSGDGGQVFKVSALGPLVSFSMPEEQVDPANHLHVLWQTGAQSFSHAVVGTDGQILGNDIYDNFNSRPHLTITTTTGEVVVHGGVRRPRPGDLPAVQPPITSSALPPAPAKP